MFFKKKITPISREQQIKDGLKNVSENSIEHGFQITADIALLDPFIQAEFLSVQQVIDMINKINNIGFMNPEVGKQLLEIMYNSNYDVYIKTSISNVRENIFKEGIRCLGNMSSIASQVPQTIDEINLQHTIEKFDIFCQLIGKLKSSNKLSQGSNFVDETLIILIPKEYSKEEILYYNEDSATWNIKPEFVFGVVPISDNNYVEAITYRDDILKNSI